MNLTYTQRALPLEHKKDSAFLSIEFWLLFRQINQVAAVLFYQINCSQLIRFKRQKIGNHQGLFAFIVLKFQNLEFDWGFLERVRIIRNRNKYSGMDITKELWKEIELQFDLYISSLRKELERLLNEKWLSNTQQ